MPPRALKPRANSMVYTPAPTGRAGTAGTSSSTRTSAMLGATCTGFDHRVVHPGVRLCAPLPGELARSATTALAHVGAQLVIVERASDRRRDPGCVTRVDAQRGVAD